MCNPYGLLDSLQRDLLAAFFARERRFFLTGGAALAGYHLRHRHTQDLDLFATDNILDEGEAALRDAAAELGAEVERVRTAPGFRRLLLRKGEQGVVVDLVFDQVPQLFDVKLEVGGVRVDPPAEVMANKLCTLLSRAELRDLVDVRGLELAGYSVEEHIAHAGRKDGGLTPGQLAWVLSALVIGEDAEPPGGVSVQELRRYQHELIQRLTAMAFPGPPDRER